MRLPLNKLATIRSGYQFRGRVESDAAGNVAVIQVKDLKDDDPVNPHNLTRVRLEKPIEPYAVEAGDVLFLSRGHRLSAAAIDQPLHRTIAPGYFFIVRPDTSRVLPQYVAWYINQAPAQARLKPSHAGSYMPIVPKSAFDELEIDVPPLETQRAIVALAELARKERQLLNEMQQARQQLVEQICLRAASRPAAKGK